MAAGQPVHTAPGATVGFRTAAPAHLMVCHYTCPERGQGLGSYLLHFEQEDPVADTGRPAPSASPCFPGRSAGPTLPRGKTSWAPPSVSAASAATRWPAASSGRRWRATRRLPTVYEVRWRKSSPALDLLRRNGKSRPHATASGMVRMLLMLLPFAPRGGPSCPGLRFSLW